MLILLEDRKQSEILDKIAGDIWISYNEEEGENMAAGVLSSLLEMSMGSDKRSIELLNTRYWVVDYSFIDDLEGCVALLGFDDEDSIELKKVWAGDYSHSYRYNVVVCIKNSYTGLYKIELSDDLEKGEAEEKYSVALSEAKNRLSDYDTHIEGLRLQRLQRSMLAHI